MSHDFTGAGDDRTGLPEVQAARFGADVQASDGESGRLVAVVVDARDRVISHVGIRMSPLRRHVHFVPWALVTEATADTVRVSIALAEIERQATPAAGITLTRSTRVVAGGKPLGRLSQITLVRQTRALRHLVVDRGRHGKALLPASSITDSGARTISVTLDGTSVERLATYRLDDQVRQDAYDRLFDAPTLRVDLPGIHILPVDGALWLRGHVSSPIKRRLAGEQVYGLPGVTLLHNELVADDELAAAVSMALAHDARAAGQQIGVYPRLGEGHLRGNVQSGATRARAGEVAAAVPAVTHVVNELRVDPGADELPELSGVTHNEDLVPGGR